MTKTEIRPQDSAVVLGPEVCHLFCGTCFPRLPGNRTPIGAVAFCGQPKETSQSRGDTGNRCVVCMDLGRKPCRGCHT